MTYNFFLGDGRRKDFLEPSDIDEDGSADDADKDAGVTGVRVQRPHPTVRNVLVNSGMSQE
jgi:hypothetical protein